MSARCSAVVLPGLWLCSLSLLASACSLVLDSDRHRSDAVPVPATQVCAEVTAVVCTSLRDCCGQPGFDFDACIRDGSVDCANEFGALVIDPRTGYDEGRAGLALAEGRALVTTCDPALHAWGESRRGLQRAFAGTVPVGGSCHPGLLETAALLSCTDEGSCAFVDAAWVCVALVPQEEECSYDLACELDLRCSVGTQFFGTGVCLPLKGVGVACGRDTECETHVCDVTCREPTVAEAFCSG